MIEDRQDNVSMQDEAGDRPPFFRTWRQWYGVILLELVILIVVFRIITVVFE